MRHARHPYTRCLLGLALWLCCPFPSRAQPSPAQDCEAAARTAEQQFALPPGLLHAIGVVETGRLDAVLGRTAPWPWAIDLAGQPLFFPTRQQATEALAMLRARGQSGVDIGCFQISLLYHPDAFPTPEQGFDAGANASVAARFLRTLYQQTGSWSAAAALYHSADPERGPPYARRVMAAWRGGWDVPQPELIVAGVRVLTPGTPGNAPEVIRLASAGPLPTVFYGPSKNREKTLIPETIR